MVEYSTFPVRTFSPPRTISTISMFEIVRHFAAVLGKLGHDLGVQPKVHRGRVALVSRIMQFGGEMFASRKAAVEVKQFQKIDDRMTPIEPLVGRG